MSAEQMRRSARLRQHRELKERKNVNVCRTQRKSALTTRALLIRQGEHTQRIVGSAPGGQCLRNPGILTHTTEVWRLARSHLTRNDPRFASLLRHVGETGHYFEHVDGEPEVIPGVGARTAFESLASGIIYQQVTWRAAKKIQERFISAFSHSGFPTPQDVLKADHTQLREVGLSRRKVEYLKSLAQAFLSNDDGSPPLLSDNELKIMPNEEATRKLCQVKGIGPWTAHMYLMFALKRVDILPTGDLVLRKGMTAHFTGVPIHEIDAKTLAGHDRLVEWAAVWEPFRSYGVWYCWRLAEGLIQPKNNEE